MHTQTMIAPSNRNTHDITVTEMLTFGCCFEHSRHERQVVHFKISAKFRDDGIAQFMLAGRTFGRLSELIDHYRKVPIVCTNSMTKVLLRHPITADQVDQFFTSLSSRPKTPTRSQTQPGSSSSSRVKPQGAQSNTQADKRVRAASLAPVSQHASAQPSVPLTPRMDNTANSVHGSPTRPKSQVEVGGTSDYEQPTPVSMRKRACSSPCAPAPPPRNLTSIALNIPHKQSHSHPQPDKEEIQRTHSHDMPDRPPPPPVPTLQRTATHLGFPSSIPPPPGFEAEALMTHQSSAVSCAGKGLSVTYAKPIVHPHQHVVARTLRRHHTLADPTSVESSRQQQQQGGQPSLSTPVSPRGNRSIVYEWASKEDQTSGKTYYYNKITKKTSWKRPQDFPGDAIIHTELGFVRVKQEHLKQAIVSRNASSSSVTSTSIAGATVSQSEYARRPASPLNTRKQTASPSWSLALQASSTTDPTPASAVNTVPTCVSQTALPPSDQRTSPAQPSSAVPAPLNFQDQCVSRPQVAPKPKLLRAQTLPVEQPTPQQVCFGIPPPPPPPPPPLGLTPVGRTGMASTCHLTTDTTTSGTTKSDTAAQKQATRFHRGKTVSNSTLLSEIESGARPSCDSLLLQLSTVQLRATPKRAATTPPPSIEQSMMGAIQRALAARRTKIEDGAVEGESSESEWEDEDGDEAENYTASMYDTQL
eukprot:m.336863 g.336863  ORF g.336863 m.336863 type:complete len:701 (+) comp16078_c2_seq55:767-2869(+)